MTVPTGIPVLAAPMFDPGVGRVEMQLPPGLTLAEIVAVALPELPAADRDRLRVALAGPRGTAIVPPELWARVRPRDGVRVVIRLPPGKNSLRSILMIVVSVAAIAIGQMWGPMLASSLGIGKALGVALVTLGANVIGSLAVNALVPPVQPEKDERRERYTISGWRNRYEPDGAIPMVLGTHRYAPPFAATSWTEIVGDWQYVRAMFVFGYGPVDLTDFRLGETSIGAYDEVEIEVRDGLAGDAPISLYPRQIVEETVGTELTRPKPRDDAGNVIDGPTIATPVVRTTAADAAEASIILAWPGGLVEVDDDGDRRTESVQVRIEQRLVTAANWQLVETLTVRARSSEAIYRQHSWTLPSRGRWQVRLTMLTDESEDMRTQRRTVWVALQSVRPEYPLASTEPLALVGLRIKATHQLNGALDDFSALASRRCLDYDQPSGTWVLRATSNPAAIYRCVLQSPANPRPVADAGIDLQQLEDWHDFCRLKGLRYDRVLDDAGGTLRDVLAEIAAAGRATPRHDGLRWGVTIDRPQTLVVDHVTPRNGWDFRATRSYASHPDGFRVKFLDGDNDYKPAERLVPWPGHVGEIGLTEALELPGKTDAAEIWREARRRMYEVQERADVYEVMQDGPVRVATRGDLIAISQDVLEDVQRAARVVAVQGGEVILDELVTVRPGVAYGLRFRAGVSAANTIGVSVVRPVSAPPGETRALRFSGPGAEPRPGDLVMFGRSGAETQSAIVTGVEMGEDMTCLLRAVPAAPQIDTILAGDVPPPWSSRVGAELPPSSLQPAEPRFRGIRSGVAETGTEGLVDIQLEPGPGPVRTARYALRHRAAGAPTWSTVYFPVAAGGYQLGTYLTGAPIELQAAALSSSDAIGPWTPIVGITVGSGDAALPAALPAGATVTALLGGARIAFETGPDAATTEVQLYRSMSPTLNRATDRQGAPVAVQPSRPVQIEVGDVTRINLLNGPGMSSPGAWTVAGGWAVSGGVAAHTAGSAGDIEQARTLATGAWYRIAYRVASVSAGLVRPVLKGGSDRIGTARGTVGTYGDRLQAVTGNTAMAWRADSPFAGSIDDVVLYQETGTCLAQGTHYFWLEPRNADGLPGPVSGPYSTLIM